MKLSIKIFQQLFKASSLTIILFLTTFINAQQNQLLTGHSLDRDQSAAVQKIMIDADYTFDEALRGSSIPLSVKNKLDLVSVKYYGFDGKLHQGQIIVNKEIANDIVDIFKVIESFIYCVHTE